MKLWWWLGWTGLGVAFWMVLSASCTSGTRGNLNPSAGAVAGSRRWGRPLHPPPFDLKVTWIPTPATAPAGCLAPRMVRNQQPLRIGADSRGEHPFHGQLARVTLWRRALSADEIRRRAATDRPDPPRFPPPAPAPVPTTDRVAEWDWVRIRSQGFVSSDSETMFARRVGQVEQWCMTDGSARRLLHLRGQGFLEVAHHTELDLEQAVTLEAWLRPDPMPAGGGRIFDKSQNETGNGYLLDTRPGRSLRWVVAQGTLGYRANLPTNRWSHVAAVFDARTGKQKIYLNGWPVAAASLNVER